MLWTENSNEHPKTRDQQKHDIEIPQNRLVRSGSRLRDFGLMNLYFGLFCSAGVLFNSSELGFDFFAFAQ